MNNNKIKKIYIVLSMISLFLCIIVNILAICHFYKYTDKSSDTKLNLCSNRNSLSLDSDGNYTNNNILPFGFYDTNSDNFNNKTIISLYKSSTSSLYTEIPLRTTLTSNDGCTVRVIGNINWYWCTSSGVYVDNSVNPNFQIVLAPSGLSSLSSVIGLKSSNEANSFKANWFSLTHSDSNVSINKYLYYEYSGDYSLYIINNTIVSNSGAYFKLVFNNLYVYDSNVSTFTYYTPPIDFNINSEQIFNNGYSVGYSNGYAQGSYSAENGDIADVIYACADTPLTILSGLLNFNILGFNVFGIFTALITICLLFFILKKLKG